VLVLIISSWLYQFTYTLPWSYFRVCIKLSIDFSPRTSITTSLRPWLLGLSKHSKDFARRTLSTRVVKIVLGRQKKIERQWKCASQSNFTDGWSLFRLSVLEWPLTGRLDTGSDGWASMIHCADWQSALPSWPPTPALTSLCAAVVRCITLAIVISDCMAAAGELVASLTKWIERRDSGWVECLLVLSVCLSVSPSVSFSLYCGIPP